MNWSILLLFMATITLTCNSKVILWSGDKASWHFAGIPKHDSTVIKEQYTAPRRGFGAVPVTVTIGTTTWNTSLFPDSHSGCYILPIKALVRKKEDIYAGDTVRIALTIGV